MIKYSLVYLFVYVAPVIVLRHMGIPVDLNQHLQLAMFWTLLVAINDLKKGKTNGR